MKALGTACRTRSDAHFETGRMGDLLSVVGVVAFGAVMLLLARALERV
jgi:hypothetical protein